MADAYIYDHVRTPRGRGKKDGALHEVTSLALAVTPLKAIKERNNLGQGDIDDVVMGCVDPVGEAGGDIARMAALGRLVTAMQRPAITLNAFLRIGSGCGEFLRRRAGHGRTTSTHHRWWRGFNGRVGIGASGGAWPVDPSVAVPAHFMPQGISADLIATKYGFSRDDVDAYAIEESEVLQRRMECRLFQKFGGAGEGRQRPHHSGQGRAIRN